MTDSDLQAPEPDESGAGTSAVDSAWRQLHPSVVTVWRWGALLNGGVLGLVAFGIASILADRAGDGWAGRLAWCLGVGAALGAVTGVVAVPMRYRAWRYRFGEHALELQRGVWWRSLAALPYQRIQQVEVEHGPLQRRLGMVSLSLRTASAISLGTIPGIDDAEAADVRRFLLQRAGLDDGA
jgi:membrane protein YdbS with pleckstrin-like domain